MFKCKYEPIGLSITNKVRYNTGVEVVWESCKNDVISIARNGDEISINYDGVNYNGEHMYRFSFYSWDKESEGISHAWKRTWFNTKERDDLNAMKYVSDLFYDKGINVDLIGFENVWAYKNVKEYKEEK